MIRISDTPFVQENATWSEFLAELSIRAHARAVNTTKDMTVVGALTEQDVLRIIVPPEQKRERIIGAPRAEIVHPDSLARAILTHSAVVCSPDDTVDQILKRLFALNIRRLPVADERKTLLGEITNQILVRNLRRRFTGMV